MAKSNLKPRQFAMVGMLLNVETVLVTECCGDMFFNAEIESLSGCCGATNPPLKMSSGSKYLGFPLGDSNESTSFCVLKRDGKFR